MKDKKILGAVLSAFIFILYFGIAFGIVFITGLLYPGEMPFFVYIILITLFGIPFIGILIALHSRIQEINSGEEEESLKY